MVGNAGVTRGQLGSKVHGRQWALGLGVKIDLYGVLSRPLVDSVLPFATSLRSNEFDSAVLPRL